MPSTLESHSESDTALFLVAIVCPPLAVACIPGITSADITTNIFLTLLGWVPGVLEAWYLISNPPTHTRSRRVLSGRTYDSYGARQPASVSELEHSRYHSGKYYSSSSSAESRHRQSGRRRTMSHSSRS